MEPLNTDERRKSLINFLIFFTITIALVVAAVLFSVEVPFKQNDQLREQIKIAEKERDFAERFVINMNSTMRLFDSLNVKEANVVLLEGKIDERLKEMDAMIDKDSMSLTTLYGNVLTNLSLLYAAKKELREATSNDASQGNLKQEIAELKNELDRAKNSLEICQTNLVMLRRS